MKETDYERERECFTRVGRSIADDFGGVFHKRGEKLRNDRLANLSMVDTDDLRNEFCWEV